MTVDTVYDKCIRRIRRSRGSAPAEPQNAFTYEHTVVALTGRTITGSRLRLRARNARYKARTLPGHSSVGSKGQNRVFSPGPLVWVDSGGLCPAANVSQAGFWTPEFAQGTRFAREDDLRVVLLDWARTARKTGTK